MREGVAVSRSPEEGDGQSNVIQFPDRAVDYTGSAAKLMGGLSRTAVILQKALQDHRMAHKHHEIQLMIERIVETMSMIEEHMDVLEECSNELRALLEPGSKVYFASDVGEIQTEIVSFIERRPTSLIVEKLFFNGSDVPRAKLRNDNAHPTLLSYDGRVACKWPRTP